MTPKIMTFKVDRPEENRFHINFTELKDHKPSDLVTHFPHFGLMTGSQGGDKQTTAIVLGKIQQEVARQTELIAQDESKWADEYNADYDEMVSIDPFKIFAHYYLAVRNKIDANLTFLYFKREISVPRSIFTGTIPIVKDQNYTLFTPPYLYVVYPTNNLTVEIKKYFQVISRTINNVLITQGAHLN
jgi:hypothetical protein